MWEYLKGTNEIGCIGRFLGLSWSVVINGVCFVVGVIHELLEFGDVLPGFAEVERSKILVEAVVDEILDGVLNTLSMLK